MGGVTKPELYPWLGDNLSVSLGGSFHLAEPLLPRGQDEGAGALHISVRQMLFY